jgi:hypothetical protein
MPIPLVIAGAFSVVAGLHSAASASRPFVERYLKKHQAEIEAWALKNAFEHLGLPDLDESPTRADITAAINDKFLAGSGFELSDVFDARAIRDDALKMGLRRAAAELGVALESETVQGTRDALRAWVRGEVVAQLTAGAGDLVDGAKDLPRVVEAIQWHNENPVSTGLLMTPEAVSNRERQARYRQGKTKHWEPRAAS